MYKRTGCSGERKIFKIRPWKATSQESPETLPISNGVNRSARSSKQNIVEGWKRAKTGEYYEFLGFAIASNAELEEDCNDIIKGIYQELMKIEGVVGKGIKGIKGLNGVLFFPLIPFLSLSLVN